MKANHLLMGTALFVACTLLVNGPPKRKDYLSLNQISNMTLGLGFEDNSLFPCIATYSGTGKPIALNLSRGVSTIIFRSGCSCEDLAISGIVKSAQSKREATAVIGLVKPEEIRKLSLYDSKPDQVLCCRDFDVFALNQHRDYQIPFVVRVKDKMIVSITEVNS